MSDPHKPLHVHLKPWRKSRGLTQEQVANMLGIKHNTLSGWESGERDVGLVELAKLAAVYGVEPAALLYAPNDQAKALAITAAGSMLQGMSAEQRGLWIALGQQLASGKASHDK